MDQTIKPFSPEGENNISLDNEHNYPQYGRNTQSIKISRYNSEITEHGILPLHTATKIANEIVIAFMNNNEVELDFTGTIFTNAPFSAGTGFCKIINILIRYYHRDMFFANVTIIGIGKVTWLYEYIYNDKYLFITEQPTENPVN